MKKMITLDEAREKITNGEKLILAADEELLSALPKGNWIAGTIPYFMGDEGGLFTKQLILADTIFASADDIRIRFYSEESISHIAADRFENGYTVLIIPAFSKVHLTFAENSHDFQDVFHQPIVGWISGVDLNALGTTVPKVFNGLTGEKSEVFAVAIHVSLPAHYHAVVDILNLFKQGVGDVITFEHTGFQAENCFINGKETNFAEYVLANNVDTRMPLVADYYGAMINTSFQQIDEENKKVHFYAPVFKGMEYKIAAPIKDYITEFTEELSSLQLQPVFSCNCILNYLYSELEGKKTGTITGPMTFGEIAYQLLNQTLVYLTIEDHS